MDTDWETWLWEELEPDFSEYYNEDNDAYEMIGECDGIPDLC